MCKISRIERSIFPSTFIFSGSQRSQSPQFEDSCQDDESFGENESVFARLEQSREALERRIGHEILIQAYSIIQVTYPIVETSSPHFRQFSWCSFLLLHELQRITITSVGRVI